MTNQGCESAVSSRKCAPRNTTIRVTWSCLTRWGVFSISFTKEEICFFNNGEHKKGRGASDQCVDVLCVQLINTFFPSYLSSACFCRSVLVLNKRENLSPRPESSPTFVLICGTNLLWFNPLQWSVCFASSFFRELVKQAENIRITLLCGMQGLCACVCVCVYLCVHTKHKLFIPTWVASSFPLFRDKHTHTYSLI